MRLGKRRRALAGALLALAMASGSAAAEDLRFVQEALAARGYAVGAPDGIMGPRTAAAIRAFETDQGWPASGGLSDHLVRALRPPRDLPPIVLRPPPAMRAAEAIRPATEPDPFPPAAAPVFLNRNWLVRDFRADGVPAGPAFGLFLEANGQVAGPRFATRMRWQADGNRLLLRYENAIGLTIERSGLVLDADRIAGEARGPDGAVWHWTAEAQPQG